MATAAAAATRDLVTSLLTSASDTYSTMTPTYQPSDETLSSLFQSLDTNHDGSISLQEFKTSSPQSWAGKGFQNKPKDN
jgi:Ca2+-binding EF-hand superfamily protein